MGSSAYIRILRPVNSLMAGVATVLGYLIATGNLTEQALPLIPVVFLITAAGNVINDYFDRDIDLINRPDRPIPSGAIEPRTAIFYSFALFIGGNLLAVPISPLCFAIALLNSVVLVMYAFRLKGIPLLGNIAVSYLAASIFLFGGALAGIEGLILNLPVAGIVFLAMISRELLKDAEDVEGDAAGGAFTLPMHFGVRNTAIVAFIAAFGAVLMSYLPLVPWRTPLYLGAITIANLIILGGAGKCLRCTTPSCIRSSQATTIIKAGMFLALAVFIASALVL